MRGMEGWREGRINVLTNGLSDGHRGGTLVGVSSNQCIDLLSKLIQIYGSPQWHAYISRSGVPPRTTEGGACFPSRLSDEKVRKASIETKTRRKTREERSRKIRRVHVALHR